VKRLKIKRTQSNAITYAIKSEKKKYVIFTYDVHHMHMLYTHVLKNIRLINYTLVGRLTENTYNDH